MVAHLFSQVELWVTKNSVIFIFKSHDHIAIDNKTRLLDRIICASQIRHVDYGFCHDTSI